MTVTSSHVNNYLLIIIFIIIKTFPKKCSLEEINLKIKYDDKYTNTKQTIKIK